MDIGDLVRWAPIEDCYNIFTDEFGCIGIIVSKSFNTLESEYVYEVLWSDGTLGKGLSENHLDTTVYKNL